MSVADEIKRILEDTFSPVHLEVRNDSHKHKGHAGDDGSGESHFHVTIVSQTFEDLSRLDRQRAVYDALDGIVGTKVHALSLKTLSTREYIKE